MLHPVYDMLQMVQTPAAAAAGSAGRFEAPFVGGPIGLGTLTLQTRAAAQTTLMSFVEEAVVAYQEQEGCDPPSHLQSTMLCSSSALPLQRRF